MNKSEKIESKDLRCKDRQALQEIIPLKTPFVIYIDPTNLCNFKCKFCPTGDNSLLKQVGRKHSSLSFEAFKKIIDDIALFDEPLKLLSMYKDGEPLLNKDFPKMVKYAKEKKIAQRIWTKTNGSLFNPTLNKELIESGIDMIHISIEATSKEGYLDIAKVDIDYDEFRQNIQNLYDNRKDCKIYIKIIDCNLSEDDKKKFYKDFENMSDFISVEKLMGWSYSDIKDFTLGIQSETYDGLPFTPKEICAYPFYVLAVNANGSVSTCGNDWAYKTSVGNIHEESIIDIWNGEKLYNLRKMFLTFNRKENEACANCYYLKIVPDNIDEYADDILKKLDLGR
jgi:radical SAM protein with 4Fe4S-binding SPASM domain